MKRKFLLFTVIAMLLICAFAIVANADSVKAESSSIDMVISFYDASYNEVKKTAKVDELFNVDFKNEGGEYYFKLTGVKSWDVDVDGVSYNIKKQLAGFYFPEGITHMPSVADGYWGFTAATADHPRKLHLPESLESLGGNFLRGIGYVTLVNEDGTNDDYMPSSLTEVKDHMFCYWTVCNDILYFPESFHNIGTSASTKWHFEGFKAANGSITIVFLGKMTFIDVDTYEKNFNPTFVFAKNKASDLWGYALPMVEGSTTVASTASYVNNTTDAQTLRLYWPSKDGTNASMDTGKQTAKMASNAPKLVFCDGDKVEYVYSARFCTGTSYPALYDANGSPLNAQGTTGYGSSNWMRFYTTPIAYDMDAHTEAGVHYNTTVYQPVNCGYDEATTTTCIICKAQSVIVGEKATGDHTYTDDFNCETALNCEVCKKTLSEAKTHLINTTVVYANGFLADGLKTVVCANDGCNHKAETKLAAIFTFKGYSTDKDESSICVGYNIDKDALSEYNAVNKALSFGAVASVKTENILSVSENKVVSAANTVVAEIEGDFNAFDFVLSGFGEAQKDLALVICAYVYDGESISYMQGKMTELPSTVTLQDVINEQKKEEE